VVHENSERMKRERNGKDADAWVDKGDSLNNQGKFDEAIKCYDKAIQLDPKIADAWNNKGESLRNKGKFDEAMKCYDKAIELDPKNVFALNNKAFAFDLSENFDVAEYYYDLASKIDANETKEWVEETQKSEISKGVDCKICQ